MAEHVAHPLGVGKVIGSNRSPTFRHKKTIKKVLNAAMSGDLMGVWTDLAP